LTALNKVPCSFQVSVVPFSFVRLTGVKVLWVQWYRARESALRTWVRSSAS